MGTGYTRQSAADIQTGIEIEAAPLNNEFNALRDFASGTIGHSHDGTTGEGPPINLATSIVGILPATNGGSGDISYHAIGADPTLNDDTGDGYTFGTTWVNTSAHTVFTLTDPTLGAARWEKHALIGRDATFDDVVLTGDITPDVMDGSSLGTSLLPFSDL